MKIAALFEDRQGETTHTTPYRHLYHMTSSHGFAYSVSRNALKTLRHHYVSTTYDPMFNGFIGGDHANFKFILNGPKLAKTYGVFEYDFHATELGVGGSRRTISLNEREIGINTRSIEPLTSFCEGLILLRPMFTQTMVQDLLYNNTASKSLFDVSKDSAPRGIEALFAFMDQWKKPIMIDGMNPRPLNKQEMAFIRQAHQVHIKGGDFRKGMLRLARDFPLKDHFGKEFDQQTVKRLIKASALNDWFVGYFQNRKVSKVNPAKVRQLVKRAMTMLGLNSNIQAVVFAAAEKAGLFHPTTPVVEWSIVFSDLVYGDIDNALDAIAYVGKRNEWTRERYDADPKRSSYTHAGTSFTDL